MLCKITVRPRGKNQWPTYRRDGHCFHAHAPNLLDESRVTAAMRADPLLLIEPLASTDPLEVVAADLSGPLSPEAAAEWEALADRNTNAAEALISAGPVETATATWLVGAQVVYTSGSGSERKTAISAVNDDGTYALSHGVKHARAEQLAPVAD